MKILVCGINYSPELTGIAVYTTDMCEYLAQKGHKVEVVTGFPFYPQWQIRDEYKGKLYFKENIKSVSVKRCYVYVTKNISSLKRIVHEGSFIVTSFFRCLFSSKPDVILIISPPLGLGVAGYVLSKLKRAPLVFHVQDLQPDAAVELGMLPKGGATKFFYAVERFIYHGASLVTTISQSMREKIVCKGIDSSKVKIVPNWSTLEIPEGDDGSQDFRKEFGLEGKFVFLYSGNVGKKQGLETLFDAFSDLNAENAVCLIVGDGAHMESLKKRADDSGSGDIRFLSLQPKSRLVGMLRAADICLVIQKKKLSDIVFPSKMTNIMAAGCASLVTAEENSELAKTVYESEAGFIAAAEDVSSLKQKLTEALFDNNLLKKRNKAKAYSLMHFDKERTLRKLESLLLQVVE